MSLSLVLTSIGALVAVVWTGVLAARSASRPAGNLIAWTMALLGLAVGLAAQALGYLLGYDAIIFRAMELGGQLVAPLAVCAGIGEITARRSAGRFVMRLAVASIAVIGIAVLGTDPLASGAVSFSKVFPDPVTYYQSLPQMLIAYVLTPFTMLTGLIAIVVGLVRIRGAGRGNAALAPVVAGVAAIVLAVPGLDLGLQQFAHITVPLAVGRLFGPAYLLAAVLIWLAAIQAGASARAEAAAGTPSEVLASGEAGRAARRRERETASPGPARDVSEGYLEFDDSPTYVGGEIDGGYPGLAGLVAESEAKSAAKAGLGRGEQQTEFFGQIQILTLVEEQAELFDQITERVVAKVRSREPGTLVYIVHEVPAAPTQRILYEVYRDRAAYEDHRRQPYVIRYAEERRPTLLAANVIEVGLQQAKVSPLPSLSDIIEQSGIDLTGVTGSSRQRPAEARWPAEAGAEPASQIGHGRVPPGRNRTSGHPADAGSAGLGAADSFFPGYSQPQAGRTWLGKR